MSKAIDGAVVLTVDETASFLRCHRSTIYRLINRKDANFPHFRVGSDYRFLQGDIEDWMRAQVAVNGD